MSTNKALTFVAAAVALLMAEPVFAQNITQGAGYSGGTGSSNNSSNGITIGANTTLATTTGPQGDMPDIVIGAGASSTGSQGVLGPTGVPISGGPNTVAGAGASASNAAASTVYGTGARVAAPDGSLILNGTAVGIAAGVSGSGGTALGEGTQAGSNGTAIGQNAQALGVGSIAIGSCNNSVCSNDPVTGAFIQTPIPNGANSVAIGSGSRSGGDASVALGAGTSTTGLNAVALGVNAASAGTNSMALGVNATANNNNSVALGAGSNTSRDNSVAVGGRQITDVAAGTAATDGVNVGQLQNGSFNANVGTLTVGGTATFAGGLSAGGSVISNVGAGIAGTDAVNVNQLNTGMAQTLSQANAYTDSQITNLGSTSTAYTDSKTKYFQANSTQPGASATGNNAVAIGPNAVANVDGSVALGSGAVTSAAVATTGATINGTAYTFAGGAPVSTVSVGAAGAERTITNVAAGRVDASSTDGVNGSQLHATNQAIDALGSNVSNLGSSTAAGLGGGATYNPATGTITAPSYTVNGVTYNNVSGALGAIGGSVAANNSAGLPQASATGANSVAIGPGAVADRANTVSFGASGAERQLTNVAAGTAPTDAANVGQVQNMVAAGQAGATQAARQYTDEQIKQLEAKTQKQAAGVGALAMASSALVPNARAEGKLSVSAGMGAYGGETAVAAGVNYYASNQLLINAKVGVTSAGPSRLGAAVGMTYGF
jgi:autotransporter adhesin